MAMAAIDDAGEKAIVPAEVVHEKIGDDDDAQSSDTLALSDAERKILDRQTDSPNAPVGYFTLFRYADTKDWAIMSLAFFASVVAGACLPLMTLVYGSFAGSFSNFSANPANTQHFKDQYNTFTLYFVYLGIGSFVSVYVGMVGFSYTGERITQRIRELYLRAIFRQNIAFFDFLGSGEITTRISSDMVLVQDGIGQKISLFVSGTSMFFSALVVGFVRSWKLTLIMLSATVALVLMMGVNGRNMRVNQVKSVDEFATAGTLAEEVISSSRNVTAYGTQKRLQEKYKAYLTRGAKWDFKSKFWLSSMIAGMMAVLNLQYALAFWQGNRFLKAGELGVAQILTVVMAAMVAGISIGHNLPHIQAFGGAVAAATKVFNTIERDSPIDPETEDGVKPDDFVGNIEFRNIKHIYPSRPDTVVVENFNLKIEPGKMVALVGASGSGKSTIFGLLERFYLPMQGQVFLDGRDISTLNLRWLRRQMALVSQEPILFSITIYESIAHGLIGTDSEHAADDVKMSLVEQAARTANAYDFIMELPEQFQTRVGERGNLLSGGQKQRIAIARAIVSDPKILLLDEATAALDTKSEKVVQEALDKASKGRTTIAIAHRLSTIRNADNIVVMAKGKVVEQGTHDQLIAAQGVYNSLVQAQELSSKIQPDQKHSKTFSGEKGDAVVDSERLELTRTVTSKAASLAATMKKESKNEYSNWELIKFAWTLNSGEQGQIALGILFCILAGAGPAVQAIFLGNSINALMMPQASTGGHGISFWCWMFFMLGLAMYMFYFGQGFTLSKASSQLVARVREQAFSAILRQDIEFFDSDTVTSGSLATFLSSEANRLAGLSGSTLGTILTAIATVIISIIVGCVFGWKLALVCTSTLPLMLGCGYFRFHALVRMEKHNKKNTDAASFACEAASSIRTVSSLSLEKHLLEAYHEKLVIQAKGNLKFMNVSAVLYALSQGLSMFIFALVFWYGGQLLLSGGYTVLTFFIVYSAIINGAQSAGAVFSFAPDMGEAREAAVVLKSFLNRIPKIDHWSTEGKQIDRLVGKVELRNVRFSYPGRAEHRILRGVDITAEPGQFVALVGASGSGKSTVMALLERFYDPTSGEVVVDGINLPDYNLQSYRAQLAIVSQETTLYTGTIRENILADRDASDEEVEQACKDANIYEFITSLPDGFNTLVGAKGALLSGGQRQRLAIARALLRDPKVLLLDEATSALDSTSERVVQQALDAAAQGRTTIAIAHRLSTIQGADIIYVFDQGKVVEKGGHEELMGKRGVYWELARLQSMGAPQ